MFLTLKNGLEMILKKLKKKFFFENFRRKIFLGEKFSITLLPYRGLSNVLIFNFHELKSVLLRNRRDAPQKTNKNRVFRGDTLKKPENFIFLINLGPHLKLSPGPGFAHSSQKKVDFFVYSP